MAHLFSSPSPPPPASTTTTPPSDALTSWHYPGPSSVYHKREKETSRHRRLGSYTTPVAPALSTAQRAQHRRVRSSASFVGALSPLPSSPALSEKSRSPLSCFASYTSTSSATMAGATAPLTPANKSIASSRPGSKMQDSPFSDYFTDDGRSSNGYGYSAPSPEAQQMLLRLNKLQSQIMRGTDGESEQEALSIVGKRLDSIELELGSLHSQTRMPMEDSGLFLEEEENADEAEEEKSLTPGGLGVQYDEEQPTKEERRAEYDYLLVQAQQVLSNVSKAQEKLKQRHVELRELNEANAAEMDEKDRVIEELKSENEAMQLDLNHDHSELLFLKLQFKALEVEFDALDDDAGDDVPVKSRPSYERKKLQEDMERWRSDWHDVDGRMRRRRGRYGVVSPTLSRRDSHAAEEQLGADSGEGEWKLSTVKRRGSGRVVSITVQRTTSAEGEYPCGLDGGAEEGGGGEEQALGNGGIDTTSNSPTKGYANHTTQTEGDEMYTALFGASPSASPSPAPSLDDYAITTSSEAEDEEVGYRDFSSAEEEKEAPAVKSPWQDLWEGLSSLAGMGEERFG